ncbi:major facilitator superfamily domain-containing protein [Microdochium trichocladiopsis]|uniref:Major facilitator superfamily domain-containing protein n=1 Tax=Microdochium trichocladiopsis TaxID=1682393 RepID=A0A9P9BLF3_9PEZI|nr:major facilitator superfamily domain-containing protein [Microdochium trichocladiopsis]KAH7024834.1 major facilitator superfamily domain-containing protein [Microdochium trichocladiopsis]
MRFSGAKKWLIVFVIAHVSLCVTCASSIYTKTFDGMEAEFQNIRIISVLGLSMFVLGLSLGPMVISPLSEFYGRRPIYIVSWTLYLICLGPQAFAKNVETILVFRFLSASTGGVFLAVAGGTVRDIFPTAVLQAPMALLSIFTMSGPSLGPVIGGAINFTMDWRWTYYFLIIWSFLLWVQIVLFIPETFGPVLLKRAARRRRAETGDARWFAPIERSNKSIPHTLRLSLLRPFQLLFFEPMCLNLCLYAAILLGIIYLFFGAFPLIFHTVYYFNSWQSGLSFLGIMLGTLVGFLIEPMRNCISQWLYSSRDNVSGGARGEDTPEFRLVPAILGSVLVPAGLFMFAWTTLPSVHWIFPMIGSVLFGAGNILLFTGIFTFLVDAYPSCAASALAANSFVRNIFAAAFPLFGTQMYEAIGFQWASSLLAFLTVVMMPFPYIFFRHGSAIRKRSRFAAD